ncbi:MAG TPA: histidinol dehydrogenase [Acidimicrobiia bacterium]|nr:histidinol dehydrogenase [Acidimicrobiia bacterium]
MTGLPRLRLEEVTGAPRRPVDPGTLAGAAAIVEEVRRDGEEAVRGYARGFGEIEGLKDPIVSDRSALEEAYRSLPPEQSTLLRRVALRIEAFADAQRAALDDVTLQVPGGEAGHRWLPVRSVGAYAPGGRHPLPSSVLMTVVPARVAGVESVWVASPRPTAVTMAAAWVAGADGLLAIGGAHAIAALAFGVFSPPADLIVGPGNRWVTAAKKHLYGEVGIDGLAGPSEIVVLADDTADPALVAADLLAQAEHDTDAIPALVTTSRELADAVDRELERQLADLPTSEVAQAAMGNGFSVVVEDLEQGVALVDDLAPEHLAIHLDDADAVASRLSNYGSLFVGGSSAEAFADYGAGPNHVLPTGGGARFQSGLSVLTYLRSPTWMRLDDPRALVDDTALLARLEGLEAHARAAEVRSGEDPGQASSPSSRIADATSTNRGQPDQSFMSPALRRLGGGAPKMPFPPPLEPGASTSAP